MYPLRRDSGNTLLTKDEILDIIESTRDGTVDLYQLIGMSPSHSVQDIIRVYYDNQYDILEREMKEPGYVPQEDDDRLKHDISAFKILMDPIKKAKYDSFIQPSMLFFADKSDNFITRSLFVCLTLEKMFFALQHLSSIGSSYQFLKSRFLPSFLASFKSAPFGFIYIPFMTKLDSFLPVSIVDFLENIILYPTCSLPILFVLYPSQSVLSTVKSLLYDPGTNQLSLSRLYYGLTFYAARLIIMNTAITGYYWVADTVRNNYLHNLNSKFWEISNKIFSSTILENIVVSLIQSPFQILMTQYLATAMTHQSAPPLRSFVNSIFNGQKGLSALFNPVNVFAFFVYRSTFNFKVYLNQEFLAMIQKLNEKLPK